MKRIYVTESRFEVNSVSNSEMQIFSLNAYSKYKVYQYSVVFEEVKTAYLFT